MRTLEQSNLPATAETYQPEAVLERYLADDQDVSVRVDALTDHME